MRSRVTLKVGASSIVGVKEFRPLFSLQLKEWEKKNKYLDLARELKKLWNMLVTIIPIVIGALSTVTKGLVKDEWRPSKLLHY